ncbi:MAG: carboxypeptidase regulatory-like domain-containing protein, partial [Gammaproteobacteria bacterium]|nr:carboxypeptidase regulatory-like domain-containing protein [Gammaproteobacteria bacterium]
MRIRSLFDLGLISFFLMSGSNAFAQVMCGDNTTDLGGVVFRDYNADGIKGDGVAPSNFEPTFGDVTNTAGEPFQVIAYDIDNNPIGSPVPIAADGSYLFPEIFTANSEVRLEFENLPDYMQFGSAGVDSGTNTQFHLAPSCNADLAVANPGEYCNENPDIAVSCFVNGDPADTSADSPADLITLHEFSYGFTGDQSANPVEVDTATAEQIGSTWGMGFQREDQVLLNAAMLKRHTGLYAGVDADGSGVIDGAEIVSPQQAISTIFISTSGVDGSGEVWLDGAAVGIDASAAASSSVTTPIPDNSSRGLTSSLAKSQDEEVFSMVGKVGFGDLDISDDQKTVYVVNLADKHLYAIDYDSVTSPDVAEFGKIEIPSGACPNGDSRPWAIDRHDGKIYVGTVCSGENETITAYGTAPTLGLTAQVYELTLNADPAANGGSVGTFSAAPIFQVDLDYDGTSATDDKGCIWARNNSFQLGCRWTPWLDSFSDAAYQVRSSNFSRATPIFADIEFDEEGFMILSFMDRSSHQLGSNNVRPNGAAGDINGMLGGDVLIAAPDGSGGFILENNGTVSDGIAPDPDRTTTGTNINRVGGVNSNQGPGGGEFFAFDSYGGNGGHEETQSGGMAFLPGGGELISIVMDPINVRSSGISYIDVIDASRDGVYEIFPDLTATGPRFAKAASLGDVELLCDQTPIEIGNRVWEDADGDGVQDPNEDPIAGVEVQLYEWDDLNMDGIYQAGELGDPVLDSAMMAVTATTNSDGEYYFGPRDIDASTGFVDGGLDPNTQYIVAIDQTQAALDIYSDTSPITSDTALTADGETNTATSTATNELHDSNGLEGIETDLVIAPVTTGVAGENDHTYDFGFYTPLSIGSYVWEDTNLDGVQGAPGDEPPIENAVVTLLVDDGTGNFVAATDLDGVAVASVTTGADGQYYFDNLPAGDYKVQVTPPAGYEASPQQDGADNSDTTAADETDSNINTAATGLPNGTFESGVFNLSIGDEPSEADTAAGDTQDGVADDPFDLSGNMTIDFGFVAPLSMGSYVWEDANGDGVQDPTEAPIPGAMVTLFVDDGTGTFVPATDISGAAVATQTTGADGLYHFTNLPSGDYRVQVTPPAGYEPTPIQDVADNSDTTAADESDSNINTAATGLSAGTYESGTFTLSTGGEPSESDAAAGDAQDGVDPSDSNGNMTVDFGFIAPVSVGSYVWEDAD